MHIMQRKGLFFMNRTYKVIWSKARRCYVVVSELAKGQHKSSNKNEQISSNVHRGDLDDSAYGDHGSFQNWGSSIGAEYGRKKTLRNGWSLEPQAQLTYNYLWGDDYTTRNGARVHQDNADSLVGRLGPVLGREFHENAKNPSRVYLKASVLHDFLGDTTSVACVTRPCKWLADGFNFKGFLCKLQTPYYKEKGDHARW